jgi:hypothetical protein
MASRADARRAKDAVVAMLRDDDPVNGVGIAPATGSGGYVVKVNLARALPPGRSLPDTVDGVPVVVVIVGPIRTQDQP